jgi:uncharacterized PurR-regulated membrane protein YhhQ (DUF165 family)
LSAIGSTVFSRFSDTIIRTFFHFLGIFNWGAVSGTGWPSGNSLETNFKTISPDGISNESEK